MLKRELIFHSLQSTGWFLFCAAAVLAAVGLIVVLMRYERKLVAPRIGNMLLALRLSVIGLLFLTLLEPVVTWTLDREQAGRILVAVDLSESMSIPDSHAAPAEKLRWARALGMIGNPAIDERLDRWVDALESEREPPWVDENETADPERRRRLAETRRENLQGIFEEIDRLPRKEIVLRLLTSTSSPLLPRLQEMGNVDLSVFAGKSQSADEGTLTTLFSQPPDSLLTEVTDLATAMDATSADAGTSPLTGVVLFTDGRDNADRDPVSVASRLGSMSAPVFPVLVGSELRPKDLAIASLDYPQTAFKDDRPLLKATLITSGFEGEELEVVLEQEGKEPVVKTIAPDGPTAAVEFTLDAEEIGRHEYTVRTDVQPGETREDNNQKSFAMNVVDDKVRVLLLEGEARWEFRFIDNALTRDERVEVEKVVYHQPYLGVLEDTFFPQTLDLPPRADDLESSPFAEPDVVIVGDIAPADMPQAGWELLEKFVSEAGGTLVLVAGKQHFPLAFDSSIVDRLVPLTNLRPVDITGAAGKGPPTERGFGLKLTPDGEREPMLQFDADAVENRNIWSGLPGHLWGIMGEAKPGATVLAQAVRADQGDRLEAEREGAVLVRQPYGFGQVVWIGVDSTWRWRHRVGDRYHHRFWGQLGRWAADNKATAGNESVKFGPDRYNIEVGDDAVFRARWNRQFLRKFPQATPRAELYRLGDEPPSQPFTTIDLQPVEGRPLVHEGRAVSLPAGEYRAKLVVEEGDLGAEEIAASLYVEEKQTLELSDLSANRPLLSQLAEVSGGRLFLTDQLHELPDLFHGSTQFATTRREVELWDHWLVMLLFFGLLTAEWVVRKLNGLP